ncbi:MAG: TonB-dependent receptor [Deltaproteobacteria bacterium]|jgi:iron complex outermembrane receptor protein|nr:TonB-dependent receptor [Deltaproteobacteria bacterium]
MIKGKMTFLCHISAVCLLITGLAAGVPSWADDEPAASEESDSESIDLNPLMVQDSKAKDGSSEVGYLVESAQQVGPWGDLPLQDTPYSMTIVPRDLIENTGAQTYEQVLGRIPQVQTIGHQGTSAYQNSNAMIRGLSATLLVDGMPTHKSGGGNAYEIYGDPIGTLEDFERVEVISGFTGFLNGGAMASGLGLSGGAINFILKRPTKEFYNRFTIGNYGGEQYFIKGDLGGPIMDGKFGYRVNFWGSDGRTAYKGMKLRNRGVSLALDWHITDDLLFQIDYGQKLYHRSGNKGGLDGIGRYTAGDISNLKNLGIPNDVAWGQKWSFLETETKRYGANLTWKLFDDNITIRAAYRRQITDDEWDIGFTNFHYLTKLLSYTNEAMMKFIWDVQGGHVFVDADFDTSIVKHKLTVGYQGTFEKVKQPIPQSLFFYDFAPTWDNPWVPRPDHNVMTGGMRFGLNYFTDRWFTAQKLSHKDIIIGDQINIADKFIILIGANHTTITQRSYKGLYDAQSIGDIGQPAINAATGKPQVYEKSAWTPNYSLVYKPTKNISLYGSYIEALQRGSFVPRLASVTDPTGVYHQDIPVRNAGETMSPKISKQYEFGINSLINDSLRVNLSLFMIKQANEITSYYAPDSQYPSGSASIATDGEDIHKGIELTMAGKITDRLTVFGGVTYLEAKIKNLSDTPDNKLREGRPKTNVPNWTAKMYLEYELPFIDRLYLLGSAYYIGKKHQGDMALNDWKIKGYSLFDAGFRFETNIKGVDTNFNLYVYNVTNKYFWDGGLGDPRTITFSVSFQF